MIDGWLFYYKKWFITLFCDQYLILSIISAFSRNMGYSINLGDLDNNTLDSIYNFYFEFEDATATEEPESRQLSNITCAAVILALIIFIIPFFWLSEC